MPRVAACAHARPDDDDVGQAKGSSHAPEIPTPTPAINLRFHIDGLAKGLEGVREGVGGLLVGEVEEEPE